MFRTILIGVDGSAHADAALRFGAALARALSAHPVIAAAYVYEPGRGNGRGLDRNQAEEVVEQARARVADLPGAGTTVMRGDDAGDALHRAAEAVHADLLVVGTSERLRIAGTQPGSVAESVLHRSPCAVVVVPPFEGEPSFRRLGVAVDAGAPARHALDVALDLVEALGDAATELRLLHVAPELQAFLRPGVPSPEPERHITPLWLEALAEQAADRGPAELVEEEGDAARRLVALTGGLDLLVCGSRDQGTLRRLLLGSVSTSLVRNASCPVLVIPGAGVASVAPAAAAEQHAG